MACVTKTLLFRSSLGDADRSEIVVVIEEHADHRPSGLLLGRNLDLLLGLVVAEGDADRPQMVVVAEEDADRPE